MFLCFCDDCFVTDEEKVSKESDERPILRKDEVETVFVYIQSWSQRYIFIVLSVCTHMVIISTVTVV
jgi:hypothetical protein